MENQQGGTRKAGAMIVTIAAVVLLLVGLAYMGHRAAVTDVVETLYGHILASPPARPESYPTEADRFDRCQKLLAAWRSLDTPTLHLEEMQVGLPFPLRVTRTLRVANPESLRKRAGEIYARDLAALSGRQAAKATLPAWESEIEVWRAAIGR